MLVAMAITSAFCIGIGVLPNFLYAILPFPVHYHPYSLSHVVTQYQLLMFSALAFTVLVRTGMYPPEVPAINLDSDWFYRRLGVWTVQGIQAVATRVRHALDQATHRSWAHAEQYIVRFFGPQSLFSRSWSTSTMVFWCTVLLTLYLLLYYLH